MVKLPAILVAAAAALLVLTNSAVAISEDFDVRSGGVTSARHQRFLRATVVSSVDDVTSLLDGSLDNGDEEGAPLDKGSLAGHAPPSVGHDSKPPCHRDGHEKANDKELQGNKKPEGHRVARPPASLWRLDMAGES
ncbi:hypothetical protein PHYPSEUDO_015351 [Phytophthora pseudosyringae]|uniref:RxLR effector protein n=1 Tax=Phytophthora pseudosyringae TaxID=221518 RepID=A0A8T1V392_9STRA|nr:hypothetical protein PHYPSEUDO_015351 [Phytophthora pseudosyringae]